MRLDMFRDASLVSLNFKMPGTTRRVKDEEYDLDVADDERPDKEATRLTKLLLDCAEWKEVRSTISEVKWWIKARKVPGNFFRNGCFLLHKNELPALREVYAAAQARLADRVAALIAVYDQRKAEGMARLKGLASEEDYPTVDDLRRKIRLRMTIVEIAVPDDLQTIDPELAAEQRAQQEAEWARATEEVRLALRQSMLDLVAHLGSQLETGEDKKTVSARSFNRLERFLTFFSHRDVTNDSELKGMVEQATEILRNVDVDALKADVNVRNNLREQFDAIKGTLGTMVEVQTARLIELED